MKVLLPAPLGPSRPMEPGRNLEADVIQGALPSKGFGEALRCDDWRGRHVAAELWREIRSLASAK